MTPEEVKQWLMTRDLFTPVERELLAKHATYEELFVHNRSPRLVAARKRIWALLHDAGVSYQELARLFGWERSTIYTSVRDSRLKE